MPGFAALRIAPEAGAFFLAGSRDSAVAGFLVLWFSPEAEGLALLGVLLLSFFIISSLFFFPFIELFHGAVVPTEVNHVGPIIFFLLVFEELLHLAHQHQQHAQFVLVEPFQRVDVVPAGQCEAQVDGREAAAHPIEGFLVAVAGVAEDGQPGEVVLEEPHHGVVVAAYGIAEGCQLGVRPLDEHLEEIGPPADTLDERQQQLHIILLQAFHTHIQTQNILKYCIISTIKAILSRYRAKKDIIMATLTLQYDGRNKTARSIVKMLRSLDIFHVVETPARKSGIELAMEDKAAGRVTTWDSPQQMFDTLMAQ